MAIVPFISITVDRPSKEYTNFMKKYHKDHKVCPKCGSTNYTTTLMRFILNMDKKEEYKNLNNVKCLSCGHSCSVHELVPRKTTGFSIY